MKTPVTPQTPVTRNPKLDKLDKPATCNLKPKKGTLRALLLAAFLLLALGCGMDMAWGQETLTVHDGTATNSYVPVYGLWHDDFTRTEMVFPSDELSDMNGGVINSISFYISTPAGGSWGEASFQVYMQEVEGTSISSYTSLNNASLVYTGSLDGTGSIMTVTLTTPYRYNGGNLMVAFYQTNEGTYKSCYFYGESVTGASASGYNSSDAASATFYQRNFLPKTMFTYAFPPTTLTLNTTTGGTVSGAGTCDPRYWYRIKATPNSGYRFLYWKENDAVVNSNALTNVKMSTDHTYTAYFAPIYNISATANGGTIAMESVTYDFDDHTMQGWTNIDADGDNREWELFSNGTLYQAGGYGSGCGRNSSADCMASGSYSNIFGVYSPDNYLVSPKVQLGGSISFYARNLNSDYPEQIAVAVSTSGNTSASDFTTISSSVVTLSEGSWTQYTIDLSGYSGAGYVAIRNYGTTDQFIALVDDITITPGSGTSVSGTFNQNQEVTLTATATANSIIPFTNWTENDAEVSTDNPYTFTVTSGKNLVANFGESVNIGAETTTNYYYYPVNMYFHYSLFD